MNNEQLDSFTFVKSCDISSQMRVKVNSMFKTRRLPSSNNVLCDPYLEYSPWARKDKAADLFVKCQVFVGNIPYSMETQTKYAEMTNRWEWNQTLNLPIEIRDLPRNSRLLFTIWDSKKSGEFTCIATASVDVFDNVGEMNTGKRDLRLFDESDMEESPKIKNAIMKLDQLYLKESRFHKGQIDKVDWMDRLVFREIGLLTEQFIKKSGVLYLNIDFPCFKYGSEVISVLFCEQGETMFYATQDNPKFNKLYDPCVGMDNIIEKKHLALARSLRSGYDDKQRRPNAEVKEKLNAIMLYPPTQVLSGTELDLVWQHRFYFSESKAGLTKFVRCVNWDNIDQKKVAMNLLVNRAVLDAEGALELLGPSFTVPEVRQYAVARLSACPDEDLLLYLLQLVQALKYEPYEPDTFLFNEAHYSDDTESLSSRLHSSVLDAECEEAVNLASSVNSTTPTSVCNSFNVGSSTISATETHGGLVDLLVERALNNLVFATALYWFLKVECACPQQQENNVLKQALGRLTHPCGDNASARYIADCLIAQTNMVERLVLAIKEMRSKSFNRDQKVWFLQNTLCCDRGLIHRKAPLPLPLDPEVLVTGVDFQSIVVFKSALEPCKLAFTTVLKEDPSTPGPPYRAIFKVGDDLRQDQLVLQLLTLMEQLLMRENLDLKLTPYRVLATAPDHGFVEFIDAAVIADILREEGSVLGYLRKYYPSPEDSLGVAPHVLDNYIRSLAGYSVITYILGVGDRHHDNLMLAKDGRFFHIDFGYILGRDPKPMPPLIKLSRELTDALGGQNSEHYDVFRHRCTTTFLCLRRHANLVLNLFSLMVDANIADIALEPERAVKKVEERFHLDLSEDQVISKLNSVIHESANAMMGAVAENFHKFTQYIRN